MQGEAFEITAVEMACARGRVDATAAFYAELGLAAHSEGERALVRVGHSRLEFHAAGGSPFYHFALNVPAGRFDAAREWAEGAVEVLADSSGTRVFDFDFWNARALYFADPAGNIVELIVHGDPELPEDPRPFEAAELEGVSEIGLVTADPVRFASELRERCGLRLWDGEVEGEKPLGFVGRKAHTLILAKPGRGWMPTGRRADSHPVSVRVTGPGLREGSVELERQAVTAAP